MELSELETLYLKRQSCREFSDKPISDELVQKICELALLSPSACNAQPWELIAVKGEKKDALAKAVQGLGMNKFVSNAPVLIAVLEGKSNIAAKTGGRFGDSDFLHNDIGILTAHLVLAAEAAGLGSCIIGWRNEKSIRAILELDEKARIPHVIALGYPPEGYEIRQKKRKPLGETFTFIK